MEKNKQLDCLGVLAVTKYIHDKSCFKAPGVLDGGCSDANWHPTFYQI